MPAFEPIPLAVNYSPQSAALKQAGEIQFDLYKLPDWPDLVDEVSAQAGAYVHFTFSAGKSEPFRPDWELIDRLLAATGTHFVNLHLSAPEDTNPGEADSLQKAIADVNQVVEHYGTERVILENVPIIRPADRYLLPVIQPEAVSRVIEASGCGLLLDLAHARLAARTLGMDEREYLQGLPTWRLGELHITGIGWHAGLWVDHMALQADDWALLDWALERIRSGAWACPRLVSFEYGGIGEPFRWRSDRQVLVDQVPELYRRLRRT